MTEGLFSEKISIKYDSVEAHEEIRLAAGPVYHHKAARAQGQVRGAQGPGRHGERRHRQLFLSIIQGDKVVPCAVHLSKSHEATS